MPEAAPATSAWAEVGRAALVLGRAGVPDARGQARRLCAAVLGVSPGRLWLEQDAPLTSDLARRVRRAVAARAEGVPTAYATGVQAFRSLELRCDRRALIPRPETEGLVQLVLDWSRDRWAGGSWGEVADIGTGTGCIALALAMEGRFGRVLALERAPEAAALARENLTRLRPATPVEVREGDLLEPLGGERVDIVVSNPPYLTEAEHAALEAEVRDHEPRAALAAGADGLTVTVRLLAAARAALRPGGLLALEVDERRAARVASLAESMEWRGVRVMADLTGRSRYVTAH